MANIKKRLSDPMISKLRRPKEKDGRLEVSDDLVPGLMLRVTTNGVKSFSVSYKVAGEGGYSKTGRPLRGSAHRATLGRYPFIKTKEARDKARLLLADADAGINPQQIQFEEHKERRSNTVRSVAKRFIARECKGHVASWKRIERSLELHVLPVLGNKPIRDIKRADIHDLLDAMGEDKGAGVGAAREVRKQLHKMFDWALDREIIAANPAYKLKRKDLKPNKDAGRALTDDELKAIWKAAGELRYPHGPWIKMLMLTGQRRSDWAKASRAEIDFERRCLEIPAARYKTGRDQVVPLVGAAWEIVEHLPIQTGDYLFSTTGGRLAINSAGRAKTKLDELAPTGRPWRFHDLRVTCETRMASLGVKPDHFAAVLGHVKQGMEAIYNKHSYLEEKRAALLMYNDHLMEVIGK